MKIVFNEVDGLMRWTETLSEEPKMAGFAYLCFLWFFLFLTVLVFAV